jgi:hypothetical protein
MVCGFDLRWSNSDRGDHALRVGYLFTAFTVIHIDLPGVAANVLS